ncbi:MAG: protein kinase, partial [Myxococcales bacterium]|nr:protein kinase [Myxococcales bacterium]
MSRDDQALAGQLVGGRYRLISPVGRGGIGTVWRVRDETSGVELALKLVPTVDHRGMPSPNKVGRFIREAQALIKLKSPYVVEVYDQGAWRGPDEEDFVYLTMELLQGEPLRERLRREGRLDARVTMRILSHVGRALALAHARGIVHRDLKPANIFLTGATDKPVSKVLDFGLVKSVAAPLATIDPVHTEHGRPLGTPYYMSPEQARGLDTVDHRSDLWALGVIAFECLTGTRPFTGQSVATVFSKIAQGEIPLPSQHGDVPPGFDAWFTKAVERDVQQRFQSTRILIDELREVLVDATTLSRSLHGTLAATLSDLSQSGATMTFLGDRTLRIDRTPTQGASFVGRKEQLRLIDEAIASHCRVINLVGTRGVGRTRLARRWAESRSPEFPGGVWLCSLDHARDADGMWRQIAATLGLRSSDRQPIQRLGRALSSMGRVLLVLERIEAVRQPLAATLAQLLHLAPQALVVVTSDAPLSLPTERVLKVSSLSYPPIGEVGDLETLKRYESVELLLRRVMAFDRSILMSPDPPAIAEVARKTGGSPLAIELLAGQARGRSMAAIAQELDQVSLHLGGTQVMDAEMVLRNTVRWAMSQLTVAAQTALVQLGVFRGRFTLAAAEAAVDLRHLADAAAVADLVETLAARGFLRVGRDVAGDTRYDLHPVIHDVVGEQLDRATLADGSRLRLGAEERHGRYFAVLGQEAALEALHERGGFIRRARYLEDAEDVATAAERALARNDVEIGVACAMAASAVEALLGRFAKASQRLVASANAP